MVRASVRTLAITQHANEVKRGVVLLDVTLGPHKCRVSEERSRGYIAGNLDFILQYHATRANVHMPGFAIPILPLREANCLPARFDARVRVLVKSLV